MSVDQGSAGPQASPFARESTGLVREVGAVDASILGASNGPLGQYVVFSLTAGAALFATKSTGSFYVAAILACVFSIPVLLNYAVLGSAMPRSGGDYVFNSRLLSPVVGFVSNFNLATWQILGAGAWTALIVLAVISPALTIIGSVTGSATLETWGADVTQRGWVIAVSVALIGAVAVLMISGTRRVLRVNSIFWFLGMVSLTIMMLVLLFTSKEEFIVKFNEFAGDPGAYDGVIAAAKESGFATRDSLLMVWPLTALAMGVFGWYFWMTFLGGEIKQARSFSRNVRMMFSPLLIALFYVLAITALVFHTFGYDFFTAATYLSLVNPDALVPAAAAAGPPVFFTAISAGSDLIATLFVITFVAWGWVLLTCFLIMPVRCALAWSLDQVFPSSLTQVSQRFHNPVVLTIVVAAIAMTILVIGTFTDRIVEIFAVTVMATGLYSQAITGLAAMRFKSKMPELYEQQPIAKYSIFGIPVLSVTGLLAFAWTIFWAAAYFKFADEFGMKSWIGILFLAVIGVAIILFYAMRAYKERRGIPVRLAFKQIPPE